MSKFFKLTLYFFCLINFVFILATFIPARTNTILPIINPINDEVSASNLQPETIPNEDRTDFNEYNILLLGLDGRHGDKRSRCDAIHIFSFSPARTTLTITSIPRGTHIDRPNLASQSAYIANNCHANGIEDTIFEIEKISGLKTDAYATVGFSQVIGILRTLNMPTTETLQYLRNRRYAIGDNQRSHNQALFFKDMILAYFDYFYKMPRNLKQFLFNSMNTNLDFETFDYLTEEFYKSKIYQDRDKIILITKPERSKYVKDLHFDIKGNGEENLQDTQDYSSYQQTIVRYLENLVATSSTIETPFKQKLWLQIEDKVKRDELHFKMFEVYINSIEDTEERKLLFSDFKSEMELFNQTDYLQKISELEANI